MPSPLRFVPDAAKLWKDPAGNPIAIAKTGRTRFQTLTDLSKFEHTSLPINQRFSGLNQPH